MIVARAPLRVSLAGGGTDLPAFARRVGARVLSVAIDKYVSVIVHQPVADDLIRAKYGRVEEVENLGDLRHELLRPVLERYGPCARIEVITCADVPAGTGLGSSGAFLVALLGAVHRLNGRCRTARELADEAVHVEQRQARRPVGFQDPFASAHGGLRLMVGDTTDHVTVSPDLTSEGHRALGWLRLYYTGLRRESSPVLRDVQRSYAREKESELRQRLADAEHAEKAFLSGDADAFSEYMNDAWRRKQAASPLTSSAWLDELLLAARDLGASAGKVIGAGGGGFLLIVARPELVDGRRLDLRMIELGVRPVPFVPDRHGIQITRIGDDPL